MTERGKNGDAGRTESAGRAERRIEVAGGKPKRLAEIRNYSGWIK